MKLKKTILSTMVATTLLFGACTGHSNSPKEVTLRTQEDSLNYALGLVNGETIKMSILANDSSENNIKELLEASDKAFENANTDPAYQYGQQFGAMLKEQQKAGLVMDSTLKFDEKIVLQGLVNGLKGTTEGMKVEEAKKYFQETIQKRRDAATSTTSNDDKVENETTTEPAK